MSIAEMRSLSLWQFRAKYLGWAQANGSKVMPPAPDLDEHEENIRRFG
jgi:hypothetical protein